MRKLAFAKDFREFPGRKTSHRIHLPEPVLRRDIAFGNKEIFQIGGLDRGHAVPVARHRDRSREAGDFQMPIQLRQSTPCDGIQVAGRTQHQQSSDQQ